MILKLLERYWAKVDRRGDDECWPWRGARTSGGYGQLSSGSTKRNRATLSLATHIALAIDGKPRPSEEMVAMHQCDNPRCVNPRHLSWGTHDQNMADMLAKGRSGPQIRAAKSMDEAALNLTPRSRVAKLTADDIRHIRTCKERTCDLARRYDVTWSCIDSIRRRLSWKHIE